MIIGIGTDIIEINRIQESIEKFGDRFLNKIFTKNEIEYCLPKPNKYQHFAVRFAAKEAVYKALHTINQNYVGWQSIEILNIDHGRPIVKLSDNVLAMLGADTNILISLSHSDNYATAYAILEKL